MEGIQNTLQVQQLLNRLARFGSCCFLDNLSYESSLHAHEFLAAAGVLDRYDYRPGENICEADRFLASNKGRWIFGHLSYELHQAFYNLHASKPDPIGFPLMTLFVPQICIRPKSNGIELIVQDDQLDVRILEKELFDFHQDAPAIYQGISLNPRMDKETYISVIERLQNHILRGDCYEINFCQEFFAENVPVDPLAVYHALTRYSPNPFSCFYRQGSSYLMCASPERFITRRKDKIYSQPIKGTAPRILNNQQEDEALRDALRADPKEQSENVMVVDLVRNDLSQICEKGTVQVEELFGVYSYPQVHQMISTISGIIREGISFTEILRATFPMGSMTGAPKLRVMQLIEQYEPSRRGLFSGSVGYITPDGNFDFNVVIRSILYNSDSRYLSYQVGSGITWYAKPENEYNECLWKAEAIRKVLGESS